jgi:hypothetical protein
MIEVSDREAAWELAERLFPTNFEEDPERSKRAGYGIYFSTAAGMNAWISDLNDRLELNYSDGTSENIWIRNNAITFGEFLKHVDSNTRVKMTTKMFGLSVSAVYHPEYYLGLDDEDFAQFSERLVTRVFVNEDILCVTLDE